MIRLTVTNKLSRQCEPCCLELNERITVAELLAVLKLPDDREGMLIVVNGRAVYDDECLEQDCAVTILPMLCGG